MAVTSIWRVKGWLGKVVVYVENPDKTTNPQFYEKADMTDRECQELDDVIAYAVNSTKTAQAVQEEKVVERFVSGVNCHPATARMEMMPLPVRCEGRPVKNDEQRTIRILCILGIIPVVWLALLVAPFVSGGLMEIVAQFPAALDNPFHIELCEDSRKTVLLTSFLLIDKSFLLLRVTGTIPVKLTLGDQRRCLLAGWYITDSFSLWVERLVHSENKSGHEKSSLYFYKLLWWQIHR